MADDAIDVSWPGSSIRIILQQNHLHQTYFVINQGDSSNTSTIALPEQPATVVSRISQSWPSAIRPKVYLQCDIPRSTILHVNSYCEDISSPAASVFAQGRFETVSRAYSHHLNAASTAGFHRRRSGCCLQTRDVECFIFVKHGFMRYLNIQTRHETCYSGSKYQ